MLGLGTNIAQSVVVVASEFTPTGYSLGFDGTNDWVDFGDGPWMDGTTDFSFQMWMKVPDFTGWVVFLNKIDDNTSSTSGLRSRFTTGDDINILLKGGFEDGTGATTLAGATTNTTLTSLQDTWVHVVVTCDRDTDTKIYINGSLNNTASYVSNTSVSASNSGQLVLGGIPAGYPTISHVTQDLTATGVSEFAFWDVALDADAVTVLWNSGSAVNLLEDSGNYDNSGDLTGYWRLDEGTGTSSEDLSQSNNGAVNNATWVSDSPWA
jgi:hypothetical protein